MEAPAVGDKIVVMGCPGSGKSTFSIRLSRLTGLPLFHLDNIWWRADRTTVDRAEFDARLSEILRGEAWIIDGDYSRTREVRLRACDTVIFFDPDDVESCLRGLARRVGRPRPDLPWTEERPDPELEAAVRSYRQTKRPEVYALLEKYPEKRRVIFKTHAQADQWLAALGGGQTRTGTQLTLYEPKREDLWFRQRMLSHEATMSFNRAWGGTIPFPESDWNAWYDHWIGLPGGERFYRYLKDAADFVGEIAFHYDSGQGRWEADVIVYAPYRGRGYGGQGLDLLCAAAKARGIAALYDSIAADNPAIGMFLRRGFYEETRTDRQIILKKEL